MSSDLKDDNYVYDEAGGIVEIGFRHKLVFFIFVTFPFCILPVGIVVYWILKLTGVV